MKISNLKVYDLDESIKASKYPMSVDIESLNADVTKTVKSLGSSKKGEGHDQFLTGIRVAFDLTFSNKAWVEAERYRFLEFVSSQSTMHRITRLDIRKCCNKYVWESTIKNLEKAVAKYNAMESKSSPEAIELYLEILYNVPSGFELTARITTNYRAIKTIYAQRKNHRLPEWREFCEYMRKELPLFEEIVLSALIKEEKEIKPQMYRSEVNNIIYMLITNPSNDERILMNMQDYTVIDVYDNEDLKNIKNTLKLVNI